jgi:hypothetical protein
VEVAEDAVVADTAIGKTVTVDTVPPEAECNVVFVAQSRDGGLDVPSDIKKAFGKVSFPVKISSDIWNVLLKGSDCALVGNLPGYLCSTMQDCLARPIDVQKKFLKVSGRCHIAARGNMPAMDVNCAVPVGDPTALEGAQPFFPHNWAGRENDLGIGGDEAKQR